MIQLMKSQIIADDLSLEELAHLDRRRREIEKEVASIEEEMIRAVDDLREKYSLGQIAQVLGLKDRRYLWDWLHTTKGRQVRRQLPQRRPRRRSNLD